MEIYKKRTAKAQSCIKKFPQNNRQPKRQHINVAQNKHFEIYKATENLTMDENYIKL